MMNIITYFDAEPTLLDIFKAIGKSMFKLVEMLKLLVSNGFIVFILPEN
jgi:hypothetical protein